MTQYGESLVPFLSLQNINTTCHTTLNERGNLSLSVPMDEAVRTEMDSLFNTFYRAQHPLIVIIDSRCGLLIGHAVLAHVRTRALTWRLQLHTVPPSGLNVITVQEQLKSIDHHLIMIAAVKTVLQQIHWK